MHDAQSSDALEAAVTNSLKRHAVIGGLAVLLLLGGLGTYAALAKIGGAVIASGTVVVETNTKRVQHQEGGIVKEIAVKNGDLVAAGDLLVRLDDTVVEANLAIVKQADRRACRARGTACSGARWQGGDRFPRQPHRPARMRRRCKW